MKRTFILFVFLVNFILLAAQNLDLIVSTPAEQGLNEQLIGELIEIFSNEKPVPDRHSLFIESGIPENLFVSLT